MEPGVSKGMTYCFGRGIAVKKVRYVLCTCMLCLTFLLWDGEDPNAEFYEKYYSDPNLILPAGKYEISATLDCSLDMEDILGSSYTKTVSAFIEVVE